MVDKVISSEFNWLEGVKESSMILIKLRAAVESNNLLLTERWLQENLTQDYQLGHLGFIRQISRHMGRKESLDCKYFYMEIKK